MQQKAAVELGLGFSLGGERKLDAALSALDRAEQYGWSKDIVENARGLVYILSERYADAKLHLGRAMVLRPSLYGVWYNYALIEAAEGRYEAAADDLRASWLRGFRDPAAILGVPRFAWLVTHHLVDDLLAIPADDIRCIGY